MGLNEIMVPSHHHQCLRLVLVPCRCILLFSKVRLSDARLRNDSVTVDDAAQVLLAWLQVW